MHANIHKHWSTAERNPISYTQPFVFNMQMLMNLLSACDMEKVDTFI